MNEVLADALQRGLKKNRFLICLPFPLRLDQADAQRQNGLGSLMKPICFGS